MGDRSIIKFLDSDNIFLEMCVGYLSSLFSGGFMVGWGFGFFMFCVYVMYFGGLFCLLFMEGLGIDVYLRLRYIDGKKESFRI